MSRDPHYYTLGPRVRAFDHSLDRMVRVRLTSDGRVPGECSRRGRPIYSQHHSSGELGPVHWYRDAEDRGKWTVTTEILCGAFHWEEGAVVDDFGTLVLPDVVRDQLWHAERRRAARGLA